jgi:arylsulfatase
LTAEPIFRLAARPPVGAPNVVVILLDDTGFAQLGCFGSGIATPAMDRLAARGLRYNRFHVTALCSPSRASLLTGRNHHAVGMGFLSDIPLRHHGYTSRIPRSAATLPRILRDNGYATIAIGKWHLAPRGERSAAGPFTHWPLGLGFERYYGFLHGDANQYSPNLVEDNHYIDPPASPDEGYHLTEDLTDHAIRYLTDVRQAAPGKPFFLYYATGAMHSPHQVPRSWSDHYQGAFDHGWDAWREQVFDRQVAMGVVPAGTILTPRPSWVRPWDELSGDERRMYARQQEVFAGFLTHTDAQIGRLIDYLDASGELDNTLILLLSDNGASAEGGVEGTSNEHKFSAGIREALAENLEHYDDWGGPGTYSHYSWGWAWAGNTPFRLWKRYTWLGGTRTPLIAAWPGGIADAGQVRDPVVHVNDLFPTVLDAVGIQPPGEVDGVAQQQVDGASIVATFTDPTAAVRHDTQYFEMLGSRSIIAGRWKATTDHVSKGVVDEEELLTGSRAYETDRWSLFDLSTDFSEATDQADEHPEVVAELARAWDVEAERNHVLPLYDNLVARFGDIISPAWPAGNDRTYVPESSPVADEALPLLFGGFRITADAEVAEQPDGVLFAVGDWNGGLALYVADGRLTASYSQAGELIEAVADQPVPAGRQSLAIAYVPGAGAGSLHVLIDGTAVASTAFTGHLAPTFQHGGARLRLGHDAGLPVSTRYTVPGTWNGTLRSVRIQTPALDADPLAELRTALHAD